MKSTTKRHDFVEPLIRQELWNSIPSICKRHLSWGHWTQEQNNQNTTKSAYKKHTGTQWTLLARIFRSLLWVPLEILLWGNDTVWAFRPQGKGLALQCDRALGWPLRENQPNREGSNSQFELYISVVPQTGHMTYKFKTETNEHPNV